MIGKVVLVFCAQSLLAQYITSQYMGPYNNIAWDGAAGPWGAPIGGPWNGPYIAEAPLAPCAELGPGLVPASLIASNGRGFAVTSASPIAVTGVTMTSENAYEGPLTVTGAIPFLAAVALEGALPTAGAGAITYGCGNGNVAMLSEDIAAGIGPYAGPLGYGPGIAGAELGYGYGAPLAYEAGIAGPAYGYRGCGGVY